MRLPPPPSFKSIRTGSKTYDPPLLYDTLDDPEIYHGAPVGVQLVARKFEEEKILAIANIVSSALQTYRKK